MVMDHDAGVPSPPPLQNDLFLNVMPVCATLDRKESHDALNAA